MGSLCENFRRTVVPLTVMRRNSFCATSMASQPGCPSEKNPTSILEVSNEAKVPW